MKEEIFSKFKDYNKELEKILEKKDFSKDTKNLLLSMFYKLDISYNDYSTVKRNVKTKQEYLENILNNIRNSNSIELVKPSNEEFEKFIKDGQYEIDLKLKKIKVIANEFAILSSILELNNFQVRLSEEYNLIRNSMPYVLNTAYDMDNLEVLRDFNAWSWNTLISEIKDINVNLIYQNIRIGIDKNIFELIQIENSNTDIIKIIKEELIKKYDKKTTDKFLELIFKVSILIYIKISENENKRLKEEKEIIEQELNEIKDKKRYIERVTKDKKELFVQLKNIDLTLNNKDLLFEEYEKRNEKLPEYNKFFSISHLSDRLQKERKKILEKIELCTKKIEPKTYIEDKSKLQKDFNLLKDINFEKENNILKNIKQIQEIFITDILLIKIEKVKEKNEIIDCMYELRYYKFLPYTKDRLIKEVIEFEDYIKTAEEKILKKLYENKIINTISTNEKNDIEIVKNIFDLKIISLEDIYLELKKKDNEYVIRFYDEKDTLEKEIKMNLEFNKKDRIKLNRKIKLFI